MYSGYLEVEGHRVDSSELLIKYESDSNASTYEPNGDTSLLVLIDCTKDEEAEQEGLAREIINRIQKLRKEVSHFYHLAAQLPIPKFRGRRLG